MKDASQLNAATNQDSCGGPADLVGYARRELYMKRPIKYLAMVWEITFAECCICGHTAQQKLPVLGEAGWDWFKGYLPQRVMICPKCMRNRRCQRDALFAESRQKAVPK